MIGYFVDGSRIGDLERARTFALRSRGDVTVLSPRSRPLGWALPWERIERADARAQVSRWVRGRQVDVVVVDGPAEIAETAAAEDVKVAVLAIPDRSDGEIGYEVADLIVAPWPWLPGDQALHRWRSKVVHVGAISPWGTCPPVRNPFRPASNGPAQCLVFVATGGGPTPRERRDMARATPGWEWTYLPERELLDSDFLTGRLQWNADVAVVDASSGMVAAVAAARLPAVVVERRGPCGERGVVASGLCGQGHRFVLDRWPVPAQWRDLLPQARVLGAEVWPAWAPVGAADYFVRAVEELLPSRATRYAGTRSARTHAYGAIPGTGFTTGSKEMAGPS